ncbi:MAG: hypothetical protein AB3N21_19055 [Ruegeria sp.]|uniref:ORC-CDC6 family AAA ATPase n=1 Tax=Ruegeria sp. TaxID=1879320 RepID=UPI00349E8394
MNLQELHKSIILLTNRAERIEGSVISQSFVDSQPLTIMLASPNNQIIYGRRGTGKTHAMRYLAAEKVAEGDHVAFLDFGDLGSNGSIYSDPQKALSFRATRLMQDILASVHDSFLEIIYEDIESFKDPAGLSDALDAFAASCTETRVLGTTTQTQIETNDEKSEQKSGIAVSLKSALSLSGETSTSKTRGSGTKDTYETVGEIQPHLEFGALQASLKKLLQKMEGRRVWLLLDEWSVIPLDLQPYVADMLRRCVFPINDLTVKIAAIEHRTNFKISTFGGQYVGLELGADVAADIDLDDFMVFDNDSNRSKRFFEQLIYNHLSALEPETFREFATATSLRSALFNQNPTFEEFVRASEGVPRDALHLLAAAAKNGFGQVFTIPIVRKSAETWYTRDKLSTISEANQIVEFLQRVIEEVIGHRKARAFLFRSDAKRTEIEELFDARLLHILKKNISSHDKPGVRYNAYKLDYGCYVNLMNTATATKGMLNAEGDAYVEVPPDDWRSIRNAILEDQF